MKRLLVNYVRPLWLTIIIGFILAIIATLISTAQPLVMGNLMNALSEEYSSTFTLNVILLVSIPIANATISFIQTFFLSSVGQKITLKLREDVFNHVIDIETEFLDKTSPGNMNEQIQSSIMVGEGYIDRQLIPTILAGFTLLSTIIYMFWIDVITSLIVIASACISVVLTALTGTLMKTIGKNVYEARVGSAEFLFEVLSNIRSVRLFNGANKEKLTWKNWLTLDQKHWMKRRVIADINHQGILVLMQTLCLSVVIIFGYMRIQSDLLTTGSVVAFLVYTPIIFNAVNRLQSIQLGTTEFKIVLEQLYNVLDTPTDHFGSQNTNVERSSFEVKLKQVSFHYPNRSEGLSEVNVNFKPGTKTLIVGLSGVGKSTILDLITSLYYPQVGVVEIGGISTVDWDKEQFRKYVGIVPQDVTIWDRTLKENLLYGISKAEKITETRISEVIKKTRLDSFVNKLPKGLNERLGPNAIQASGGERQRIALARALLRNPEVLLFDEVTSALDPILTEEITQMILSDDFVSTKIIVSHRLTFASQVDQILVVNPDGTVTAGDHESLKQTHKLYNQLVLADQFKADKS